MAPKKAGEQLAKEYHNAAAPLTLHTQRVMVKLTAPSTAKGDTAELDFVAVLDTSGSMWGKKLQHMQAAMRFVIKKLGENDKLAIVTFSSHVNNHGYIVPEPLNLDAKAKEKAENVVNGLAAWGDTNIEAGLRAGIQILKARGDGDEKRAACIFLMSDGVQNIGDARRVLDEMPNWTVHTFGFGEDHDGTLLWELAQKSHAGVYHHVLDNEEFNHLSHAFAPSLAQYRSISMLKLRVTLTPRKEANATIVSVDAGEYRVKTRHDGTWTIEFGDLAREENRRIMIGVQLPSVPKEDGPKPIMEVQYVYTPPRNKTNQNPTETTGPEPLVITMYRDAKANPDDMKLEVKREVARNNQADFIRKMMDFADRRDMDGARLELKIANKELSGLEDTKGDATIAALHTELDNIEHFLVSYDAYRRLGRAYMLACLSSHRRQRYTARGGEDEVPLFLTDRMKKYQGHAHDFHKDPNATHI